VTIIWVAYGLFIGQCLVAIVLRLSINTLGVYVDRLVAAQHLNIEIRKNLAIQNNEKAITYLMDNPTEREA
jgi:hypothetical protein